MFTSGLRFNHTVAAALVAFCGVAAIVRADLPAALDLIPADATIAGGIEKLDRFQANLAAFRKATGGDTPNKDLDKLDAFFQMPGMKKTGSAAIAIIGDLPEAQPGTKTDLKDMPVVILAPIEDYAQLVSKMGGDPAAAVAEIKGPQNSWFVKNSGSGYIIASPKREITESFQARAGNLESHKKALGAVGQRAASKGDFVIMANIPKLGDRIKKGVKDAGNNFDRVAAMQGADAPNLAMLGGLADPFVRDAQVAVFSTTFAENGMTFDAAAQFKEGSELGKLFNDKGNSENLTGSLPNKPFLLAFALDTSKAAMKALMNGASAMQKPAVKGDEKKENAKPITGMTDLLMEQTQKAEGMAVMIGYPKAGLAAGLFSETVCFMKTSDADGLQKALSETFTKFNGQVEGPNKYICTYAPAAKEISGAKVYDWTVDMQPADPAGADPMGMVKGFLTGPAGKFQGCVAPVKNGVVMTYSQYEPNVAAAITAANEGNGLAKGLAEVSKNLPENRTFELYLGSKSILEAVSGVMQMMGQQPLPVPADLAPVALGGTTDSSGLQVRAVVPASVFKTMAEFSKAMQGPGGPDPMDEEPVDPAKKTEKKDSKPKF